jgi:hypothetical protein
MDAIGLFRLGDCIPLGELTAPIRLNLALLNKLLRMHPADSAPLCNLALLCELAAVGPGAIGVATDVAAVHGAAEV